MSVVSRSRHVGGRHRPPAGLGLSTSAAATGSFGRRPRQPLLHRIGRAREKCSPSAAMRRHTRVRRQTARVQRHFGSPGPGAMLGGMEMLGQASPRSAPRRLKVAVRAAPRDLPCLIINSALLQECLRWSFRRQVVGPTSPLWRPHHCLRANVHTCCVASHVRLVRVILAVANACAP